MQTQDCSIRICQSFNGPLQRQTNPELDIVPSRLRSPSPHTSLRMHACCMHASSCPVLFRCSRGTGRLSATLLGGQRWRMQFFSSLARLHVAPSLRPSEACSPSLISLHLLVLDLGRQVVAARTQQHLLSHTVFPPVQATLPKATALSDRPCLPASLQGIHWSRGWH